MLQAGTARAAAGSVFVVTNTNDSGDGSLRQAIATANADPAVDVINFNIGTGLQIIELASSLPAITSPIDIHGGSQPGFSGNPLITIDCGGILGCTNLWVSGASVQVSAVELTGGHGTKDFGGALNNFGGPSR